MKNLRKTLALLLALCMLTGMLGTTAFAEGEGNTDETVVCANLEGCTDETHAEGCPLYVAPETEDEVEDEPTEEPEVCETCGQDPCVCEGTEACETCGQDPCVCEGTEACETCGQDPCVCEEPEVCEHQWNDGEVTTAPGCETEGVKTFTCTVDGCGETKTEAIEATGHEWIADEEAEESEGGVWYVCEKCGASQFFAYEDYEDEDYGINPTAEGEENPQADEPETAAQKLQAAINNCPAGGTVTLTGPVSIAATADRISVSHEVVLDLNGQTINATTCYAIQVKEGGKLTVQDSVGGGKIAGVYDDANNSMVYVDGGEFTLASGELSVDGSATHSRALYVNKGTANITGGTITAAGERTIGVATANATVEIDAVTITASGEGARAVSMLDGSTGDIKITGATLLATGKDAVCVEVGNYSKYSNKMTITESTLSGTGAGSYGLYGRYKGTVEITKSTITAAGYGIYFWGTSANITDTNVTSSGHAIYGTSSPSEAGTATIKSGTFTGEVYGRDTNHLKIEGGAFDVNVSKYVPESKKQNLDGEVLPAEEVTVSIAAVAQIGDTIYENLADAFAAVNATEGTDSVTLTILSDCAPTANEQLRITRDNVVIEGRQNRSGNYPTIDCGTYSCSGQAGVLVSGDNVTVKNLKVTAKGDSVDAIKVTKVDADALVQNVTLDNLELTHKATWTFVNSNLKQTTGHGLNLHGVDGATVTNVTATGTKCGMSLANAKNVTVSGSEIGGKWGSIGMMYKAEDPAYTNPVTLTLGGGNTFTGAIYSERPTEAGDTVNLTADQTADIFGAKVEEGSYTLTTDKAVAKVDGFYYATLQAAIDACPEGGTVKVLKDTNEDITLPLKSLTLTSESEIKPVLTGKVDFAAGAMPEGAQVTIENLAFENTRIMLTAWSKTTNLDKMGGLTIRNNTFIGSATNDEHNDNVYAIHINNADVALNNLTITGNAFTNCGKGSGGCVYATVCGELVVTGNTFTDSAMNALTLIGKDSGEHATTSATIADNDFNGWACTYVNANTEKSEGRAMRLSNFDHNVDLTGNSFVSENLPEEYVKLTGLAEGKKADVDKCYWGGEAPAAGKLLGVSPVLSYYKDAGMTELVVGPDVVAQVGDKLYTSLQEAIIAANSGENKTVALLADQTVEVWNQIWNVNGVTIDGQDHTLTVKSIYSNGNGNYLTYGAKNLTVKDLTVVQTDVKNGGFSITEGSKLENVKIIGGVYGALTGSDVTITGCTFENVEHAIYTNDQGKGEDLKVTDNTFTGGRAIILRNNEEFTGNTVTAGEYNGTMVTVNSADATVTNNKFSGEGALKLYKDAKIEGNAILCKVETNNGVTADLSGNYWGGSAPTGLPMGVTAPNWFTVWNDQDMTASVPNGTGGGSTSGGNTGTGGGSSSGGGSYWGGGSSSGGGSSYRPSQPEEDLNDPEVPLAEPLPFADVAESSWYYEAVRFVYDKGMMVGTGEGNFSPSVTTSRAMIASILWRLKGEPEAKAAQPFSDVADGRWYTKAVAWAAEEGVFKGYEGGKFSPNGAITREQLAAILWRYAGQPAAPELTLNFADADKVSSYAQDAMRWAVDQKIITGKGGNILDPGGKTTRAEAAQMLMKFCELQEQNAG